ncbi:MAG: HyaD/HybD family hydrogenase maturation endopeptidase [Candidatus Acidiferrum sp.]
MSEPQRFETVVIGVGNTILSDDGVGVHVARLLEDDTRVPKGVNILDGGTIGLDLVPYLSDASRILFLDAINSGGAPGTLTRMTAGDLLGMSRGWSAHQLGVADLIAALLLVASSPQEIVVLGVQPGNTDWGTTLSAKVEAALAPLVEAAVAQLCVWSESRQRGSELHNPLLTPEKSSGADPSGLCDEGDL